MPTIERRVIAVEGTVQGVGFRPFVHRLATELALRGFVRNDVAGVLIDVEGEAPALDSFLTRLTSTPPPLAAVSRVEAHPAEPRSYRAFTIEPSGGGAVRRALVTPDVATCDDCLAELTDPADRRFRYPFVNCTQCGPRLTIVRDVPYDRARTTMATFGMCDACRREYEDPRDRRFHAQPIACPACGPTLALHDLGAAAGSPPAAAGDA